jgi:hypothetical protein
LLDRDTFQVHIGSYMKSHRIIRKVYSRVLAFVLLVAIHVAATSSLSAQAVPLADTCLIYTTRSTSKGTGYQSYSSSYPGIVVVGPEFTATVEGYAADGGVQNVDVIKRKIQDYSLSNSRGIKSYSTSPTPQERIAGVINLAKANSTKPSISLVFTFGDSASSSFSDSDTFGKATWKSPYTGVAPGWLANSLSSAYKFYDVNPDRNYDDPDAPTNFLGQKKSLYLPCAVYSGKTTFALDARRSASVKGMTFEEACAALEASLEASGYERQ